jgi:hypothetical protein
MAEGEGNERDANNSWAERRDMYPSDQRLRRFGFVIHSRVKDKEPVWLSKDGKQMTETIAHRHCDREIEKMALVHKKG